MRRNGSTKSAKFVGSDGAEAGGFLVKQKARAGGGRRKKPQPFAEGSPDDAGQPCRPCVHGTAETTYSTKSTQLPVK